MLFKKVKKRLLLFGLLGNMIMFPTLAFSQTLPTVLPAGSYELTIGARPSAPYPALANYNQDLTASGTGSDYTDTSI
ncbi:hypothetical protein COMNV_01023 [Commensalibacter sp. Nvir]|nr:hypothetical protein COMNV_01023 [Commensalibacter sp. Nvir]